ncbi:MAG: HIRAN domain-containing protein [Planctomycetota bacterium]|jgi:hypothetical protein|nr:HIRAN domain-containing protein [Planctomycetota bacterium]
MKEVRKSKKGGSGSILPDKDGDLDFPMSSKRNIFLLDTYVAGTSHIRGIEELMPRLDIDDRLDFFREPENPHDARAIVIKTTKGVKIGYVPKAGNLIISRLMDAGRLLFGEITSIKRGDKWPKIGIKVFLHD